MWTLLEDFELRKRLVSKISDHLQSNAKFIKVILMIMGFLFAVLVSVPTFIKEYNNGGISTKIWLVYGGTSVVLFVIFYLVAKLASSTIEKRAEIWRNGNIYFILGTIQRKRQGGSRNNKIIWWDVLADGDLYECSNVLAKSGNKLDGKRCVIFAPDVEYIQKINRRNQDSYCFILDDFFTNDFH